MIGLYNQLLRKVFRFHYQSQKVVGSLGHITASKNIWNSWRRYLFQVKRFYFPFPEVFSIPWQIHGTGRFTNSCHKCKPFIRYTLQGINISPWWGIFEDDFPSPQVGYVSFLEGTSPMDPFFGHFCLRFSNHFVLLFQPRNLSQIWRILRKVPDQRVASVPMRAQVAFRFFLLIRWSMRDPWGRNAYLHE